MDGNVTGNRTRLDILAAEFVNNLRISHWMLWMKVECLMSGRAHGQVAPASLGHAIPQIAVTHDVVLGTPGRRARRAPTCTATAAATATAGRVGARAGASGNTRDRRALHPSSRRHLRRLWRSDNSAAPSGRAILMLTRLANSTLAHAHGRRKRQRRAERWAVGCARIQQGSALSAPARPQSAPAQGCSLRTAAWLYTVRASLIQTSLFSRPPGS